MRFRGAECSHIVTQLSPELLHRAKLQLGRLWAAPPTPSPAPDPPPGCLYASGSSGVTQRLAFCDFGRHPVLEVRPCRGRRQNVPFRGSVMPRCLPGPRPTSPPIRRRAPGRAHLLPSASAAAVDTLCACAFASGPSSFGPVSCQVLLPQRREAPAGAGLSWAPAGDSG